MRYELTDHEWAWPEETAQYFGDGVRNHDEMTLAMVTSKERDYLWSFLPSVASAVRTHVSAPDAHRCSGRRR
jgi:hypothetical protein